MATTSSLPLELQSATTLLAQLCERKVGSLELLDTLFKRIERLNPKLNAVVTLDMDRARVAARAADNALASKRGPLHGLPMTIKDSYEVAGVRTTCGMPEYAEHRPAVDADGVALLRAAGAIPFGKTNVPYSAADHQTYNPIFGTTNNPWDLARTPGGSSGGPAAAVAAGFTPLELGSDIAGSIRCPAHFCGIYGHKPSYGVVPMRGHIPPPPGTLTVGPLGVGGPLARSATDLELALDILTTPAELDRTAWSIRLPQSRHARLADFRVAVWMGQGAFSTDSRCLEAMREFVKDLHRAGAHVSEAHPDIDLAASDDLYVTLLFAVVSIGMPEEIRLLTEKAAAARQEGPRSYPTRIARAVRTSLTDFVGLEHQQQVLCRKWRTFFKQYDVLLCPAMPTVAFPHDQSGTASGHMAQYDRRIVVDGQPVPYLNNMQWPGLVTIANLPATAIPTGRLIEGVPMGLQVIGPYLEDRTTLRFAQLVEEALGGYKLPPFAV